MVGFATTRAGGLRAGALALAVVAWVSAICYGFWTVESYQNAGGESARAAAQWPAATRISRKAATHTLLIFAHPKCPCTRASIGELAKVMSKNPQLEAHVVFLRPVEFPANWERTDLWEAARRIPGVRCWTDVGGREAQRFGARTSGAAYLYDPAGILRFHGGVTVSRGHHGDNDGAQAVLAISRGELNGVTQCDVFGCPLFSEKE